MAADDDDQGILDFENKPAEGLTPGRAIEAAQRLSRGADADSRAAAAGAIEEAERLALGCHDPRTQMRAYEVSGDFHRDQGAFTIARKKYETALGSARLLAVTSDDGIEDVERLRFKLSKLRNAANPLFKTLEKVAAQRGDSYEKRNIAWASYKQDEGNLVGRVAARVPGSEEDFRKRLDAAKWTPTDEDDEEIW